MIEKGTKTRLICDTDATEFNKSLNKMLEKMYKQGDTVIDIKFGGYGGAVSALILYQENTND